MLKQSVCNLSAKLRRTSSVFSFYPSSCSRTISISSLRSPSTAPWMSCCLSRQLSTGSCLLRQVVNPHSDGTADPRVQAPKQPPPATVTGATSSSQERIPIHERYPAIQQLRKVNFREGKEPYKIYNGSLTGQFKMLKIFSISTTGMGLVAQPMIYQSLSDAGAGVAKAILALSPVFLFTYITPIFIHFLSKRYVTEMFYNPVTDTYTGVMNNFFLVRKEFEFKTSDVIVPEVPGMLTTFLVKSKTQPGKTKPIFVMDTCFTHLEHYGRLMKFDEPIDLRLEDPSDSTRTK